MLLVGDFVTNAITHAPGGPVPTLDEVDGAVQIAVHDDSPIRRVLVPPYQYMESGRSRWLVTGLSCRWRIDDRGADPGREGRVVRLWPSREDPGCYRRCLHLARC
jgi:hypothetical protein